MNYSTLFLFLNIEIIINVLVSHLRQRLTQMQYSTYIFNFQTLYTVLFVSHLWQRLSQVNHSTIFLFLEVEIYSIIDIFLSFAAEANANAILYIFNFQTLHTVFFCRSFAAKANTSELLYHIFCF